VRDTGASSRATGVLARAAAAIACVIGGKHRKVTNPQSWICAAAPEKL